MPHIPFIVHRSAFIVLLALSTRIRTRLLRLLRHPSQRPRQRLLPRPLRFRHRPPHQTHLPPNVPTPSYFVLSNDGKFLTCNASDPEFASKGSSWGHPSPPIPSIPKPHTFPSSTKRIPSAQTPPTAPRRRQSFRLRRQLNSSTIAAFPINPDGSLGEHTAFIQRTGSSINPQRQAPPLRTLHPHRPLTTLRPRLRPRHRQNSDRQIRPQHRHPPPQRSPLRLHHPGSARAHSLFHPNNKWFYVSRNGLLHHRLPIGGTPPPAPYPIPIPLTLAPDFKAPPPPPKSSFTRTENSSTPPTAAKIPSPSSPSTNPTANSPSLTKPPPAEKPPQLHLRPHRQMALVTNRHQHRRHLQSRPHHRPPNPQRPHPTRPHPFCERPPRLHRRSVASRRAV